MKITESQLRRIIRQVIKEAAPPGYENNPAHVGPDPFQHFSAQNQPSKRKSINSTNSEPEKYIEIYDDDHPETDLGGMPLRGRSVINPEWQKWDKERKRREREASANAFEADRDRINMQDGIGDYDDIIYQGQGW